MKSIAGRTPKFLLGLLVAVLSAPNIPIAAQADDYTNLSGFHYARLDFDGQTHYYVQPNLVTNFDSAAAFASNSVFRGLHGFLPTVTNSNENTLVTRLARESDSAVWLGIQDTTHDMYSSPSRTWNWVQGPEAGSTVTTCSAISGPESCTNTEAFSAWSSPFEPNNDADSEYVGELRLSGSWNDIYPQAYNAVVVEFVASSILPDEDSSISPPTFLAISQSDNNAVVVTWADSQPSANDDNRVLFYDITMFTRDGYAVANAITSGWCDDVAYCPLTPAATVTFTRLNLVNGDSRIPPGDYIIIVRARTQRDFTSSYASISTSVIGWQNTQLPSDNFTIVAAAPTADVLHDTGTGNKVHDANGSGWYFNDDWSWGFAQAGDFVTRWSCDVSWFMAARVGARLCWHTTSGYLYGGYRAGSTAGFGADMYRAIYVSDNPSYYPKGPQPNVSPTTLTNGGWTLCFSSTYADTLIPLAGILAGCQGQYMLLAGMAGQNDFSPGPVPAAPQNIAAQVYNAAVLVAWMPPTDDGGSDIIGYVVSDGDGHGCTAAPSDRNCTVVGLPGGHEYAFTVRAENVNGFSDASEVVAATPFSKPSPPRSVVAQAGDGQSVISWSAPENDGGFAITGYKVTASTGQTCSTTVAVSANAYSCTVEELDNLKFITFTVVATNDIGDSDASDASLAVVNHTPTFQVWVPSPNVARSNGSAAIVVFGAENMHDVRVRVGNQNLQVTPVGDGMAAAEFRAYPGAASRWRVQVRAVQGTGASSQYQYAFGWVYAPQMKMRAYWSVGSGVSVRVLRAAPGSHLTFKFDGDTVCTGTVAGDGTLTCQLSLDTSVAGDYQIRMYDANTLVDSKTLSIRGRR